MLGVVLLVGITVLFVTGLVSYAAYNPDLSPVNDKTPDKGLLGFYLFAWPTDPPWLYRLTQGVHVTLGIALIPVLLAKLWSVVPKLFALPPARSLAHALERLSLLLLVGGALFEFITGVLNVQLDYLFPGSFYPLHFYGAWVFFAAFVAHAVLRVPAGAAQPAPPATNDRRGSGAGRPRTPPRPPSRGAAPSAWSAAARCCCSATTAGRSFDGPLRADGAARAARRPRTGCGPGGFQINKTAASRGISTTETSEEAWRLVVEGPRRTVRLSRAELLQLPLHSAALPIACVEGWSTSDQRWRGVRLRDWRRSSGTRRTRRPTYWWSRSSGTARSAGRPCATTRCATRVPCSPCSSTASP